MHERPISNPTGRSDQRTRASLIACVVFAVGACTIPKLVSTRSVVRFSEMDGANSLGAHPAWCFVAVSDQAGGFTLLGVKRRVTLEQPAFVAEKENQQGEVLEHVSVLKQVGGATLLETVKQGGESTITSRYRVDGQTVDPISTQIFSSAHLMIGLALALLIAFAVRLMLVRLLRRSSF